MDERIAILETKVQDIQGQNKAIMESLNDIKQQLTRYKGFLGGIVFVFSSIAAGLTLVLEYVRH